MRLVPFVRRHRAGTSAAAAILVAALTFGLYWFQPWKLWTNTTVDEAIPAVAEAALTVQDMARPSTTGTTGERLPAPSSDPPVSTRSPASTGPGSPTARSSTARPSSTAPGARPPVTRKPSTVSSTNATPQPSAIPSTTVPPTTAPSSVEAPEPQAAQLLSGTLISHEHETSGSVRVLELADGSRVLTLEGLVTSNGPDVHVWLAAAPVIPGNDGWYVFDDAAHVDLGELKGNLGNQVYRIPPAVDLEQLSSVSVWCERFSVSFGAAELS